MSVHPPADWRGVLGLLLALLLLGLGSPGGANADDATTEHARLAAVLRQLDTIERLVAQETTRPRAEHPRYHFDYARLREDIERVRGGIRDYLSPQRAQPRDLVTLVGGYRQESAEEDAP